MFPIELNIECAYPSDSKIKLVFLIFKFVLGTLATKKLTLWIQIIEYRLQCNILIKIEGIWGIDFK